MRFLQENQTRILTSRQERLRVAQTPALRVRREQCHDYDPAVAARCASALAKSLDFEEITASETQDDQRGAAAESIIETRRLPDGVESACDVAGSPETK